jgi:hypothetical protein
VDAPQPKFGGGVQDAFVAKISSDGKRLIYSTYLGGADSEWGYALAAGPGGTVVAVGQSASLNFPVHNPLQSTNGSLRTINNPADGYIVKLSPAIERPRLGVAGSGKGLLISWPTNFSGFVLESSASLRTTAWKPLGANPIILGSQFTIVHPADSISEFFRLHRP